MFNPLVTVAISCYNVEKFIMEGIKYVINQTYSNLQIIIVNDGSTDSTPKLCDSLLNIDSRIEVIHKSNGGLGSARNTGIENAKGKYISFFDVDDTLEYDFIENMVNIAEKDNVDLIINGFYVRNSNENTEEKIVLKEELIESNEKLKEKYINELLFIKHGNGFVCTKFYNLEFINENKIRFGSQKIQQDEPFNNKLYPLLKRVYVTDKAYYHYIIYETGNNRSRYIEDRLEIFTDIFDGFTEFYTKWEIANKKVLNYIYRKFYLGIINACTYNLFHENCPLGKKEKVNYLINALNNEKIMNTLLYVQNNEKLDFFANCLVKKKVRTFIFFYKLKMLAKKILKR